MKVYRNTRTHTHICIDFHGGRAPLAYAFQRVSLHPHTCSTCKTGRTGFTTLYITSAYGLFLLHFGKFWSVQAGRLTTFSLNFKRSLANLEIISNSAKLNQKSGGVEITDLHFGYNDLTCNDNFGGFGDKFHFRQTLLHSSLATSGVISNIHNLFPQTYGEVWRDWRWFPIC